MKHHTATMNDVEKCINKQHVQQQITTVLAISRNSPLRWLFPDIYKEHPTYSVWSGKSSIIVHI